MGDNGEPNNRHACASCKHQRRKCEEACLLAPYFPFNRTTEFQAVHKVFGVSNITKMVKSLEEGDRKEVVKSLIWEAQLWEEDRVHGPLGNYRRLEEELNLLKEEVKQHRADQQMRRSALGQWTGGRDNGTHVGPPDAQDYIISEGDIVLEASVNNFPSVFHGEEGQVMNGVVSPYHPIAQEQEGPSQGRGIPNFQPTLVQVQEGDSKKGVGLVVPYQTHVPNYPILLQGQDQRGRQGRDFRAAHSEGMIISHGNGNQGIRPRIELGQEMLMQVGNGNGANYSSLLPSIQGIVGHGSGGGYLAVNHALVQSQGSDHGAASQQHWRNSNQNYNIQDQFNQADMEALEDSAWK